MRASRRAFSLAPLALASALCSCQQIDIVAIRTRGAGSGGAGADAGASGTGGSAGEAAHDADVGDDSGSESPDAGPPKLCSYRQRSVTAGGTSITVAALVARGLSHALCACSDKTGSSIGDTFETDAFDSSSGPYKAGSKGGDVGVNQGLMLGATSELGGSLIVAGGTGVSLGLGIDLRVHGALEVGGQLAGAANVLVDQDAEVADRIDLADLSVGGTLTQPSGATLHLTGNNAVHATRTAEVLVGAPCACDAASVLDIAAVVGQAHGKTAPATTATSVLDAQCGEFTLDPYDPAGLHLDVRKPAAIYLAGDLHLNGDLVIETADRADVDFFIDGNLKVDGKLVLGSNASSGRVRLYVGSSGTTQLGGGGELHGVLYAPLSEVVTQAKLTVYGAILATRFAASAPLIVHYDESVTRD